MRTQKDKTEYMHIRINKKTKDEYIRYCEINGFTISKKIRLFIENELKENGKKND